jgi:hypothetical protein
MGQALTESVRTGHQKRYLLEDTFAELDKLYEDDEQTTNGTASNDKEAPLEANISKLAKVADQIEIPEKSIKLEGKADKIYDLMISMLKRSKLADAVTMLELISKDDKLKLLLQHGFAGGSNEDGKLDVTMSDANIPVKDLKPTQSEIGIKNSLGNLVSGTFSMGKDSDGNEKTGTVKYEEYFQTPALKAAGPVFVYKGTSGNYIVDGHHRWSQIYCMNPDATAYCKVITTSKALSDEQILKNFHAAIAADPNRAGLGRKEAGFENLFGANDAKLKEFVKSMQEAVAAKIIAAVPAEKMDAVTVKIDSGSENQKKAQAYLVSNALQVAGVARPSNRKRILMPQTDKATFSIIDGALAGI